MDNGKDDWNMEIVIERILSIQDSDNNAFIKIQQKRLRQLQDIQKRKDEGKTIRSRKAIIAELKSSGILDEGGNLAEPYSGDK